MLHANLALFKGEVVGQQSKNNKLNTEETIPKKITQQILPSSQTSKFSQPLQIPSQLPNPSKPIIRLDPSIAANVNMDAGTGTSGVATVAISKKKRVMLCGTYPIGQSNGYSRVVYYISKFIGLKAAEDIQLTIYGFQNFKQTAGTRNDIPSNVILHDAMATEEPKRGGFGEKEIGTYLKGHPQDIVIIFNDMVITAACVETIVNELTPVERKSFKLISYMDQVYPYQKKQYIQMLNTNFDGVITFTPYWRSTVRKLGLEKRIPCYVFPHGFDHTLYYPIPRKVARIFYSIPDNAFAILNLNRNQPRKRFDHTMMAFALVVKKLYDLFLKYKEKLKIYEENNARNNNKMAQPMPPNPIRLVIGTAIDASWNLLEVLEHELMLLDVPFDFGKECIIAVANPQQLSDRDINVLYNSCDVGLNTCEGEGFGLCQIEHLALGCPQVCPKIGGLQEFANANNSHVIETKWRYYVDKHRDGIGGIAEIGDPVDYAEAIWKYYSDPKLLSKHSKAGRNEIIQHYKWETVVDHFHKILLDIN